MVVYRICERKKGELYTLFHGVKGSRKLPVGKWIEATIKPVRDGSRRTAKEYISGFHSLASLDETRKFTNRFSKPRDLVIVECEIKGPTWSKEHSPANIILSKYLKLNKIIEEVKWY